MTRLDVFLFRTRFNFLFAPYCIMDFIYMFVVLIVSTGYPDPMLRAIIIMILVTIFGIPTSILNKEIEKRLGND